VSVRASIAVTAAAATVFTLLVSVSSAIPFAYRNPELHVATETLAAVISFVAAQLAYGRFRQHLELRDLLLTAALGTFAVANLLFSAIPAVSDDTPGGFVTWAPVAARLLGAGLMAASAMVGDKVLRHPVGDAARLLAASTALLALVTIAVALAGDALPAAIPPDLSPESSGRPRIVGSALVLGTELAGMLLFLAVAVGYARRARATGDEFARWLAIAGTLATFARLNYFLFPSRYSQYFYTGDVLRLGFFLALTVGGAFELMRTRHVLAVAAVREERERIARDIHDGVAQDLAFIMQHGRRLATTQGAPVGLHALVVAAERGLDECRQAIASLTRTGEESLDEALVLTAVETASREGVVVETEIETGVSVPANTQDALLRVTREAIINSVRHGGAETVTVKLSSSPILRLEVSDDGCGFDVESAVRLPGRQGLRGMHARVHRIGGELAIDSQPGHGTRIEVSLP
jgi:signal transduction histidine kinase